MILYVQRNPDCLIVVAEQICQSGLTYIFKDYGAYGCVLSCVLSFAYAYSKYTGNWKATLDTLEGGIA
jgi:hypothetical protein